MNDRDTIAVIVVVLLLLLGGAVFLIFKFRLVAALVADTRARLAAAEWGSARSKRGRGRGRGSGRHGRGMVDEEGL